MHRKHGSKKEIQAGLMNGNRFVYALALSNMFISRNVPSNSKIWVYNTMVSLILTFANENMVLKKIITK